MSVSDNFVGSVAILRDVCDIVDYGYTASSSDEPIGPKFLRITDIVPDLINWESVPYCAIEPSRYEKYRLNQGDIVIARTGATTGYAKWIKDPHDGVFASYLVRLRVIPDVDDRFIGYIVESADYKKFIELHRGGAAQPNANAQVLTSYPVRLPSLQIQRRIADVLSAYDDLIENNTHRIAVLEKIARMTYREWFVDFRFPGHEQVEMVESELGPVPAGWEVRRLGEVAEEVRRTVDPANVDPETPYFGLEHLPRRSIALAEWGRAADIQSAKLAFECGDVLFGKIRPYFHKVGVAPVVGICSTDAIVIRPRSGEYRDLVLACVSSDDFVAHATQTSQGTKMPRANWNILVNYRVAVPPSDILRQFSAFMEDAVRQIHNLVFQNRNLRRTRDLLLPKLISGEIEVPAAEEALAGGAA